MIFESDQTVDIVGELHLISGAIYKFRLHHEGWRPAIHVVVGLRATDLVRIFLTYDGVRFQHPVVTTPNGELVPIKIYGGRDRWSQLLRDKAMEAVQMETKYTPKHGDN